MPQPTRESLLSNAADGLSPMQMGDLVWAWQPSDDTWVPGVIVGESFITYFVTCADGGTITRYPDSLAPIAALPEEQWTPEERAAVAALTRS